MYETQYLIFATIGSVSLLFALGLYRWHQEVELFGVISLGCWAVLTFESANLVVPDPAGGTQLAPASFPTQLLCLGLALVSVLVIFGAMTGRWPADTQSQQEAPV